MNSVVSFPSSRRWYSRDKKTFNSSGNMLLYIQMKYMTRTPIIEKIKRGPLRLKTLANDIFKSNQSFASLSMPVDSAKRQSDHINMYTHKNHMFIT